MLSSGASPFGGDLYEKDKHFPSMTYQGICAPEVNEVWSVKTSWDGMS